MTFGLFYLNKFGFSDSISEGVAAMISAFIGIVLTTAITFILLSKQSKYEGEKDCLVHQFEKKQDIYYSFFNTLEEDIVALTEQSIKDNKGLAYANVVVLEKLIFQFGYLRIHMGDNRFFEIMSIVSAIFNKYKELHLSQSYQQQIIEKNAHRSDEFNNKLYELTYHVATQLFKISQILNEDLYGWKKDKFSNSSFKYVHEFLESCGLKKSCKLM